MAKNREVRLRAQRKYDEAHKDDYKSYHFKCNKNTEADIIEYLDSQDNKNETIRNAIRNFMRS